MHKKYIFFSGMLLHMSAAMHMPEKNQSELPSRSTTRNPQAFVNPKKSAGMPFLLSTKEGLDQRTYNSDKTSSREIPVQPAHTPIYKVSPEKIPFAPSSVIPTGQNSPKQPSPSREIPPLLGHQNEQPIDSSYSTVAENSRNERLRRTGPSLAPSPGLPLSRTGKKYQKKDDMGKFIKGLIGGVGATMLGFLLWENGKQNGINRCSASQGPYGSSYGSSFTQGAAIGFQTKKTYETFEQYLKSIEGPKECMTFANKEEWCVPTMDKKKVQEDLNQNNPHAILAFPTELFTILKMPSGTGRRMGMVGLPFYEQLCKNQLEEIDKNTKEHNFTFYNPNNTAPKTESCYEMYERMSLPRLIECVDYENLKAYSTNGTLASINSFVQEKGNLKNLISKIANIPNKISYFIQKIMCITDSCARSEILCKSSS